MAVSISVREGAPARGLVGMSARFRPGHDIANTLRTGRESRPAVLPDAVPVVVVMLPDAMPVATQAAVPVVVVMVAVWMPKRGEEAGRA